MKKSLSLFIFLIIALYSCRKDVPVASKAVELRFSTDTVFLDTVFTSIGSSTYNLRVFNPGSETVILDEVSIGGSQSFYSMNVNGTAGNKISNVEILGGDSIHIFIEVKHNKKPASLNFILEDSIGFFQEGYSQHVKLVTTVRDAYFHFPNRFIQIGKTTIPYSIIAEEGQNIIWPKDKPHVIYGYGVVDENATLTIEGGTEVYFHQGSGMWVYEGASLKVAENAISGIGDSVIFAGDRLEPFYEDAAGQWGGPLGGIFIQGNSGQVIINNAVIKNATTALQLDSSHGELTRISNSYILNSSRVGIYGGFANLEASNIVVANAGVHLFYALGGNYDFTNCTFANYWNGGNRSGGAVTLSNYLDLRDSKNKPYRLIRELNKADFSNCIIVGNNNEELSILQDDSKSLNYFLQYCMIDVFPEAEDRSYDLQDNTHFSNILTNADPDFVNSSANNYQLGEDSQAKDRGTTLKQTAIDIIGYPRIGTPDLGAYERKF